MSFFIVSENDIMRRTLEDIYFYQEYELKRVPYKKELIDLYVFQKIIVFHAFILEI